MSESLVLSGIVSALLAGAATYDGIFTAKAIAKGNVEVGPAKIFLGATPSKLRIFGVGAAIIGTEAAIIFGLGHAVHNIAIQALTYVPFLIQSVFHIVYGHNNQCLSEYPTVTPVKK